MLSSNERVSAVNEGRRVSMPWRLRLYLAVEAAVRAAMAATAARVMAGGLGRPEVTERDGYRVMGHGEGISGDVLRASDPLEP